MATAFDPETQSELISVWQAQLQRWIPPFLVDNVFTDRPMFHRLSTNKAQVSAAGERAAQVAFSANLIMAYVHQLAGLKGLNLVVDRISIDYGWDRLLEEAVGRSASALDREARAFALSEPLPSPELDPARPILPLTGVITHTIWRPLGAGQIVVQGPEQALLFEVPPHVLFSTSSGETLNPRCVPRGATVTINGEWLEQRHRARVDSVHIEKAGTFKMQAAPADTVAYLTQRLSAPLVGSLSNTPIKWLVAVRDDGSLQQLMPLGSGFSIASLPVLPGGHPHFLFGYDLFECDRTWFVHYDFEEGQSTGWLGPPNPVRWFWRSDRQDLVFSSDEGDASQRSLYRSVSALASRRMGQVDAELAIVGWNRAEQRLVAIRNVAGQSFVGLLNMNRGEFQPVMQSDVTLRLSRRLSPDGNWLAYWSQWIPLPPDRLFLVNLKQTTEQMVLDVKPEEGLTSPVWSPYLGRPALAVLAGPVDRDFQVYPNRLLVVSPEQPDQVTVVTQAAAGELLAFPLFCHDGSLLYRAEKNGEYRLVQKAPGLRPETLLTTDRAFEPVACGK